MEDTIKIVCPICGEELLPAEVYIPDEFFGRPTEVIRDAAGKIEFFLGKPMGLEEEYVCDGCGAKMRIKANLSFTVDTDPVDEEDYVTVLNRPKKIKLSEENLFDMDSGTAE